MTSGKKRRPVAKCDSRDSGYRKVRSFPSKRSKTGSSATGREGDSGDRGRCTLSKQKSKLRKGSVAPAYSDSEDEQEIKDDISHDEQSSTTMRNGGTSTNNSSVKVATKRKPGQASLRSGRGRGSKKKKKSGKSSTTTANKKENLNLNGHGENRDSTANELFNHVKCGGGGGYVCDGNDASSSGQKQGNVLSRRLLSSSTIEEETTTTTTRASNGIGGGSCNNTLPDHSLVGRIVKIYCEGEWLASRVLRPHIKKPFLYLLEPLLASSSRKNVSKEWTLLNGSATEFMFSSGIVWGQCKGYPPWPGIKYSFSKSAMESKLVKKPRPSQSKEHLVIFFSTDDSAWLPEKRMSTFEPTPEQLNAPLDMLRKGQRKNKALVKAVKDAVKELIGYRALVEAALVDELESFASQLSSPTSWIGLQVRATKARKGAVCGIVRAYSAAQRKWLIVWKGDDPLNPPPPPAWYGKHALQLDDLPSQGTELPPPLPGSGICHSCFVKNVYSDTTDHPPLVVITCVKCKNVYHGCCLDPPVPNSLIASAATFQETTPPRCNDSYLSEDDEKEQQVQGTKHEDEKEQRQGHDETNRVKLEMNEIRKKRKDDEDVGTMASVTTALEVQVEDPSSSPPVNCCVVDDQEKYENVERMEANGTLEEQLQPSRMHSEGDDGNNNTSVDLINNGSLVGASGDAQQQNGFQYESLSTASCEEGQKTSPQKPENKNNDVMSESSTVHIIRNIEERRTLLEAEKDLPKLRSLLPGAENGQWICDGCIECNGCGVSKRNDSSVKLHEKNLLFFCFKMDHGIENDSEFPNFDVFAPPPTSYSMLCKACTTRSASGSFCPICDFTWKDEEEQCNILGCDLCHFWVHAECEGFSSNEEFILIQTGKHQVYGEGSRYACPACRARMQIDCLCSLINDDCHDFFALPVTASVAPGYSKVIKNPMDLCTIERKMMRGIYCTMQAMRSDVELMVLNALTYNPRDSPVYKFVLAYYSCCEKAFAAVEIKTVPSPHGVVIRDTHMRIMKAPLNAKTTAIANRKNSAHQPQQSSPPEEEKKGITTNSNSSFKNEPCEIKIENEITQLRTLVPIPDPTIGFRGPILWLTKGEAFYLLWMEICSSCGSAGSGERFLYCRDCGEAFHDCCVLAPGGSMDVEARAGWYCNNCKICSLCSEARPNDDGVLIFCEVCDRAYHTDCLQPPLPRVPEGRWVCGCCVKCKDCSIPLTFREWSVTHDACKFCLRHCLRSHLAQDGVVWKRRQKLISVLRSGKGRGAIMSEALSWKTKPLETLSNDQCPVCTGRWGSGGSQNHNQKPTALCECCGLYVHPQCDPDASKLCTMISSGTCLRLFDFFCASCLGIDLMQPAQELAQLDKLLREESIYPKIDDDNNESISDVIDSNGLFSNHLGSSEAVLGMAQKVGAIQRQRILLSSAFLSRFINVAALAAETSLRVFNVTTYEGVIDKARDMIEQLEQGTLEGRREGKYDRCQFLSWKRSRAARFLRSYRMEKSNVKLRAALGHPGEVVKKMKSWEQHSKAENYLKQELVVRQAMRAAAFITVVSAELDLPMLDDFILMLSNQCPIDAPPPPSITNGDIVSVDNSDLESGVQAVCQQDDDGGINASEVDKMSGVENRESYTNQGNCGETMLQSKCNENRDEKERIDVSKLNDSSACMMMAKEEAQGVESDSKVQQQAPAVLHHDMNAWTEICHAQFGEWFDPRECIFCHDVGDSIQAGRLLPFEDGQWVHVNCLTWSSEVYENVNVPGELLGAYMARSRSKQLRCSVCGERGATIDCQRKLCRFIFHFPCAILAGVKFCKDHTVWCNYHAASCVPKARQKTGVVYPTAPLDTESVSCDIGKHLRIVALREVPTGQVVANIPQKGEGSGETKNQAVEGNLEIEAPIPSKQKAALTTTTSPPPGNIPQIHFLGSTGSPSLAPIPPPPPGDFSLIEGQRNAACGLRFGSLTVYSLGELRPQRPGTSSRTHLFPVLDSADKWSIPFAPSGYEGVFFRISESGSSWAVSATSLEEVYESLTQALRDSRGPEYTIPNRRAIGNTFGLNGPQFFGLGLPEVRYALECLPESVEAAMDCSEFQRYRFCFVKPDGSFVRERRRKKAEVAVVTKINPTGAARAEIRTHAVIANLVGRSSRTLLRSADSIIEQSVSLDGNNVIIRGERNLTGGRRSAGVGNSNTSANDGCSNSSTAAFGDDSNYSDNNGNAALAEIGPLQAMYRSYKMRDNGGGMCIVHRSKIHGWGLFAMKDFDAGDILVEYMGEVIRQCVADRRESKYEHLGVGSCYLFKIENDAIVDATRMGNVARFINHCCDPNAAARVLPSDTAAKKIVIIAKKAVKKGDEVTYDYKFAYEEDKLACHCGASNCMGSMN